MGYPAPGPMEDGSAARLIRPRIALPQMRSVEPILVAVIAFFVLFAPSFATVGNIGSIAGASAVIAVAAAGETLVLIVGGIDLSVAAIIGCSAVLSAGVMGGDGGGIEGLVVALGVGAVFGLVNGVAIGGVGLTPFVFTLGTFLVARGIAFAVSQGLAVRGAAPALLDLQVTTWLGIPFIAWVALGVLLVTGWLLRGTTWGRLIYLIGSNDSAARYSGLPRELVRGSAYLVAGLLSGLAGYLSVISLGVGLPGLGDNLLLPIIGAIIVGGTSLFGGEGSMWRTLIGVLLLATLSNGLNLMGFAFYDQLVAQGLIILAGTAMAVRMSRRRV